MLDSDMIKQGILQKNSQRMATIREEDSLMMKTYLEESHDNQNAH